MTLALSGCDRSKDAASLATSGGQFAQQLSDYYQSLKQDQMDSDEFDAFLDTMRGTEDTTGDTAKAQEQVVNELEKRRVFASSLSDTYKLFTSLSGQPTSADVKTAASTLIKNVQGISSLKGAPDTSSIVSDIVSDLVQLKEDRDLDDAAKSIQHTLENLSKLLTQEKLCYETITKAHVDVLDNVAQELVKDNKVTTSTLFSSLTTATGLTYKDDSGSPPANWNNGIVAIVKAHALRLQDSSNLAFYNLQEALADLIKKHSDFRNDKALDLTDVNADLARASSYLSDAESLQKPPATTTTK